jgi:hypothetical protein
MQRTQSAGDVAISEVSMLPRAWSKGDESALERLTPIAYRELHRLAGH